ncbi:class III signal peptide-containing protein [Methanothermobacter tenebrarum]|uniref:Class III signal peptide-containing protein n=1 Tax=Methanothermobacter tenebrarum TaxID=680118 RepID=A0A328PF22_9EURY|nr:class III signal peptide-containing protein [Methanothermobacter tenebrarum]MBC7117445.1 class III signal peptide-containing protein [Methanobacteriaceae archaeon]NPV64677.1 class III signal peptide-containing protein [Methanobacteriaceae archaeon]RAO79012.1 hypothetical protein DPC56_05065 [Methanothermobacter tenebrarum]
MREYKGQISAEFVLLTGFILVVAIIIASQAGSSLELDQVMSAAKTGTIEATNDLAYNGTGNLIRFQNITFKDGKITITVYSKKRLTYNEMNYIKGKVLESIGETIGKQVTGDLVKGRYNYTVEVVNVT